jgi:uncharacterized protein with PIN domain
MFFEEYYNQIAHKYPIEDLKYLLVLIVVFYITLIALRINGVMKKDYCPKCGGSIKRISKTLSDRICAAATLGIIPLRRYKCEVCFWKGLRWNTEKSFYVKKRSRKNTNSNTKGSTSATTS